MAAGHLGKCFRIMWLFSADMNLGSALSTCADAISSPNFPGFLPTMKDPCTSSGFASKAAKTASAAPSAAENGALFLPGNVRHQPAQK